MITYLYGVPILIFIGVRVSFVLRVPYIMELLICCGISVFIILSILLFISVRSFCVSSLNKLLLKYKLLS